MKYLDIAIANDQIKTTDIKGKEYAEVNQRIKAFRIICPNGCIKTEMLSNIDGVCVFKASVYDEDGKLLGTGTAYEKEDSSFINRTSFVENAETSAVGRALGMLGLGIDTSVASAEEVANAMKNQEPTQEEADEYKLTFGKFNGKTLKEVYDERPQYIDWLLENTKDERMIKLIELATGKTIPSEEASKKRLELLFNINNLLLEKEMEHEDVYKHYGIHTLNELSLTKLKECEEWLKGGVKE